MQIKRYSGKYPEVTNYLLERGAISGPPKQIKRVDLVYDEGIDIVYELREMTPAKFKEFADTLLLAAFTEAERYKDERYRFAKFVVRLNRTAKGRKTISPIREYTAAKHPDSNIMVYGEKALGYELPEEYKRRPFLINKVEDIIGIPESPSPGPYVVKQRPYKVLRLIISLRAGMPEIRKKIVLEMREKQRKGELE